MLDAQPAPLPWHGVPPEHRAAWANIFYRSHEGMNLSSPCPVCHTVSLHCWYLLTKPGRVEVCGELFSGRGSKWEWCSHCRSYEHGTAPVPTWWRCDLAVDIGELAHQPEILEVALQRQR